MLQHARDGPCAHGNPSIGKLATQHCSPGFQKMNFKFFEMGHSINEMGHSIFLKINVAARATGLCRLNKCAPRVATRGGAEKLLV